MTRTGRLTKVFFDDAWKGLQDGRYSANYEFVEAAKAAGFDLHEALPIVDRAGDSYDYEAIVPFDTFQRGWWDGGTMWQGAIPLRKNEVEFLPRKHAKGKAPPTNA